MMFVKTVLFGLKLGIFVAQIIICDGVVNISAHFQRWLLDNIRVNNVDATFYNLSVSQCASECSSFHGCVSFNWHTSKTCELNTKLFDFSTFIERFQQQWRVYEKGNCGLGIKVGNHCIMLPRFLDQTNGLSFESGRDVCLSGHADLVKIANEAEMANLNQYLNNLFPFLSDNDGKFWTGLNKMKTMGFVWSDMTDPDYTYYAENEPHLADACVLMTNIKKNWKWKTEYCWNKWTFVCERRNV
jgi:hypothetical protein